MSGIVANATVIFFGFVINGTMIFGVKILVVSFLNPLYLRLLLTNHQRIHNMQASCIHLYKEQA
jgi:hypothetical protein